MLPVSAAFVVVLIPYSAGDLVNGTATAGRVLTHSLLLLGLALLALAHFRDRGPGGRTPAVDSNSTDTVGSSDSPQQADQPTAHRRVRLRPVSRRHAA